MGVYNIGETDINSAYDINSNSLSGVYTIGGRYIPFVSNPQPLDYSRYLQSPLFTYTGDDFDDCDHYNGVIAQIQANDKLYLFDLDNESLIIGALPISARHGNSVSFSKERYDINDEFPLFYSTAGGGTQKVYVSRITRHSATLIKTIFLPIAQTGYHACHVLDEDNGILYMIGYSEDNYRTDDGGANKTVVSKWDMTDLTDNGDDTITPAFISSYERDFIYVMQGLTYFDGYIWIASGYWDSYYCNVFAMNPATGEIDYTLTLNDKEEIEGVSWVYDSTLNKYWMLVSQQNHTGTRTLVYSRIDFDTLT